MRLLDEVAQHRLGNLEVGDDPVFHRANGHDITRGTPEHLFGLLADG